MNKLEIAAVLALTLGVQGGATYASDVVDVAVSFDVLNINRSKVPCPTGGGGYELVGSLVAPESTLEAPTPSITVYLPGSMATVAANYRPPGFESYDLGIRMAELGHASLFLDRLAMGESGTPNGYLACVGGDADTIHQVIQQLRAGSYELDGTPGVAFDRVALAGYSGGGMLASIGAYSFHNVDGLLLLASAFDAFSFPPDLLVEAMQTMGLTCGRGGDRKHSNGPGGYSYIFEVGDRFFHDIEPGIRATLEAHLEREPCGNWFSYPKALVMNRLHLGSIDAPVLLVGAEQDFLFPRDAVEAQAALFRGSSDVSVAIIENAGHVAAVERGMAHGRTAAERFRLAISDWLVPRGF